MADIIAYGVDTVDGIAKLHYSAVADAPEAIDGGYYVPTIDSDGNLTWTASADNMPAVAGVNIKGPKGDIGSRGPQGPAGADGSEGPQGTTPALSIGTVTTLAPGSNATVELTGSITEPVLNFGIPKGATGDAGEIDVSALEGGIAEAKELADTKVSKTGDTMTGALQLPRLIVQADGDYPSILLYDSTGTPWGRLQASAVSGKVYLSVNAADTAYLENYFLPAASTGLTTSPSYNILTTKDAVTVAQGGHGGKTAAEARTNLDVPPTSHASTAATYGIGTDSNYGHVKLSDSTSSTSAASAGIAASPAAVKAVYDLASGKQAAITGAATTITSTDLTASRALISNSSGKVAVSGVTSTELGYLDGVTSNVQTQLNAKQATLTGGATTIATSNLTESRALVSNGSGKVAVSAVTSAELGYLDGVTSNVQTQLDGKAASSHTQAASTITAGTFAGYVLQYSGNNNANRLRNAIVQNSSGTAQSTNYLIFRRK